MLGQSIFQGLRKLRPSRGAPLGLSWFVVTCEDLGSIIGCRPMEEKFSDYIHQGYILVCVPDNHFTSGRGFCKKINVIPSVNFGVEITCFRMPSRSMHRIPFHFIGTIQGWCIHQNKYFLHHQGYSINPMQKISRNGNDAER